MSGTPRQTCFSLGTFGTRDQKTKLKTNLNKILKKLIFFLKIKDKKIKKIQKKRRKKKEIKIVYLKIVINKMIHTFLKPFQSLLYPQKSVMYEIIGRPFPFRQIEFLFCVEY